MQTVQSALEAYIHDPAVFFVFPTDIAASAWAEYALRFEKAVALERFTAWDRFKSESIRAVHQNKNSIPSVLRKLFVLNLLELNKTEHIFHSLIPDFYAAHASGFADWIASLLPQLASWEKRYTAHASAVGKNPASIEKDGTATAYFADAEDADLYELKKCYSRFLDEHNLFEPAWEMPPFESRGNSYVIVYPEILQDFDEYRTLLEQSPSVNLIHVPQNPSDAFCRFTPCATAAEELRRAALFIRSLCTPENGRAALEWTDIAVSVPDTDTLIPYVLREFSLYDIPVQLRSGKSLSRYPAGKLFSLIKKCADEDFSFETLRSLLCDASFPWKDTTAIHQLIEFGIQNNCMCSYDGTDIWEEAFKKNGGEERCRVLYRLLKKDIAALNAASSFEKIRERYFIFKNDFFTAGDFLPQVDLILSRCIAELGTLIDIERSYPDAAFCREPFAFFVKQLDSKDYVQQSTVRGVSVFPYRLAAGAPFKQHIVLNASQNAVNAVHTPLSFLRSDKRAKLGVQDSDTGAQFAVLYALHSEHPLYASYAEKTFTGYALAHAAFSTLPQKTNQPSDSVSQDKTRSKASFADAFEAERNLFACNVLEAGVLDAEAFTGKKPSFIHSIQKTGFDAWCSPFVQKNASANGTDDKIADFPLKILQQRIDSFARDSASGKIRVSASSLNSFYTCPVQWLFSRVLRIKEYEPSASLADDVFIGTLYHEIIKRVLSQLRNSTQPLQWKNEVPAKQVQDIEYFTREVIEGLPSSCGLPKELSPLTVEMLHSRIKTIADVLSNFFAEFTAWFSGCTVVSVEESLSLENERQILEGTLDCVLERTGAQNGDDGLYIVDFKTGAMPSFSDCIVQPPDGVLTNFQLAAYIRLYESVKCSGKPWVNGAFFFSIHRAEIQPIVGSVVSAATGKTKPYRANDILSRTEANARGFSVDDTLQAFERSANDYVNALCDKKLTLFTDSKCRGFFPDGTKVPYKTCAACEYKALCRKTYVVSGANDE